MGGWMGGERKCRRARYGLTNRRSFLSSFPPSLPPPPLVPCQPHGGLGLLVPRHGIPRCEKGPANVWHLQQKKE